MAVQKSKVSRSKRGKRRSHDALKKASLSTDVVTGEKHRRHHMTSDGSVSYTHLTLPTKA